MLFRSKTYQQQKKRTEAQSILIEKIASGSRNTTGDNSDVLSETLTLAEVLLKKEGHPEALLYARRPLKGYRRMGVSGTAGAGKALQLLVTICHAEGNIDEEEAYTAILSNFIEHKLVSNASNWNGNFQTGSPALVGCATNTQPGASFSSQLPASNLTPEEIREFEEIELERQRQLPIRPVIPQSPRPRPPPKISSHQKDVLVRPGSAARLTSSSPDLEIRWNIQHEPPSADNDDDKPPTAEDQKQWKKVGILLRGYSNRCRF